MPNQAQRFLHGLVWQTSQFPAERQSLPLEASIADGRRPKHLEERERKYRKICDTVSPRAIHLTVDISLHTPEILHKSIRACTKSADIPAYPRVFP